MQLVVHSFLEWFSTKPTEIQTAWRNAVIHTRTIILIINFVVKIDLNLMLYLILIYRSASIILTVYPKSLDKNVNK